jgi:hypothetical protein
MLEKERETIKQKLHDKEDKNKKLENAKQQLFYDFEKERAKWYYIVYLGTFRKTTTQ